MAGSGAGATADTTLTPAVAFRLMAGEWAKAGTTLPHRIKGWAAPVMLGADEAKHLQAVWSAQWGHVDDRGKGGRVQPSCSDTEAST